MEWFVPKYFEVWMESAQEDEQARMKRSRDAEEDAGVFLGFGRRKDEDDENAEEAWAQWLEWVEMVIAGREDEDEDNAPAATPGVGDADAPAVTG